MHVPSPFINSVLHPPSPHRAQVPFSFLFLKLFVISSSKCCCNEERGLIKIPFLPSPSSGWRDCLACKAFARPACQKAAAPPPPGKPAANLPPNGPQTEMALWLAPSRRGEPLELPGKQPAAENQGWTVGGKGAERWQAQAGDIRATHDCSCRRQHRDPQPDPSCQSLQGPA